MDTTDTTNTQKYYFDDIDNQKRLFDSAKRWMGTPFLPNSCKLGIGVDCVRLCMSVVSEAGYPKELIPDIPKWNMSAGKFNTESAMLEMFKGLRDKKAIELYEFDIKELNVGDLIPIRQYASENHLIIMVTKELALHTRKGGVAHFLHVKDIPLKCMRFKYRILTPPSKTN